MTSPLTAQPSAWAETTWYDESAALGPRDLELVDEPGDHDGAGDEPGDPDELDPFDEDDDYRD